MSYFRKKESRVRQPTNQTGRYAVGGHSRTMRTDFYVDFQNQLSFVDCGKRKESLPSRDGDLKRPKSIPLKRPENYSLKYIFNDLIRACEEGKAETVQKILNNSQIDVNQSMPNGMTPLFIACKNGHLDVVNALLSKDEIDVNKAQKAYGNTPLHMACWNGYLEIVKALLRKQSINVNQAKNNGETPLWSACNAGRLDVVKALLSKNDINANQAVTRSGITPLWIACFRNNLDIVKALLSRNGIDVNQANKDGITPLSIACTNGRSNIAKALVYGGCEVSEKAKEEYNYVKEAVERLPTMRELWSKPGLNNDVLGIVNSYESFVEFCMAMDAKMTEK